MPRTVGGLPLTGVTLDRDSASPLHRQLYEAVRGAILARRLRPGRRLPSTRTLAADLRLSRNTVVTAFEQLLAEGYLEGRTGSGTYVTRSIPDEALKVARRGPARGGGGGRATVNVSQRVSRLSPGPRPPVGEPRPFGPGPAVDLFPLDQFARIAARQWRRAGPSLLSIGDPAGYDPLRQAVAAYLGDMRGVDCEAGQVIIVNGGQEALYLAAHVLADPGDAVWVEDPGYVGVRRVFDSAGVRVLPVPVDEQGLSVTAGAMRGRPRVIHVSPSHQYPLGVTMSASRRIELLRYAAENDAVVIEDDFDSEYRYSGRSIPALQGLDRHDRVVYVGTFGRVLVSAIRLGYLVVPHPLVDAFVRLRSVVARHSSTTEQAIVAEFLAGGHFERHLRRMRAVYEERQAALVDAARRHLSGLLTVDPSPAGMHLLGGLAPGIAEEQAVRAAAAAGVDVTPLAPHEIEAQREPTLLLGYAAWSPDAIRRSVRALEGALRPLARRRPAPRRHL